MKSRIIQKNNHTQTAMVAPIEAIQPIFEGCRRIMVASHVDPDGDAIGTQLAFAAYLRSLGKEVILVREAEIPARYRFLHGVDSIADVRSYDEGFLVNTALILECQNVTRIGQARRLLTPDATIVNIDHHQDNDNFGDANWIDARVSSVGEMAFEYLNQVGYRISSETAEHLYTAILTDTGRFRHSSTSSRTMTIAGLLMEAGADPQRICDNVYYNLRPSTMKLIGKVLNSVEFLDEGSICLLTLTHEMLDECGAEGPESEGIVDFTLFTKGVLAGALLKGGSAEGTKVSLRSRNHIDVAALAARFGGGGHAGASGCVIPLPLPQAKRELIRVLREARDGRAK